MRHALLLVVFVCLLTPRNALSDCPESSYQCNGVFTTTAPRVSTQCAGGLQNGTASVNYDLEFGSLHVRVNALSQGWAGSMDPIDEYVLLAPDSGSPVEFQAEYRVTAQYTQNASGGSAAFEVFFRNANGFGPILNKRVFATTATDTVLVLPLSFRPGVPFLIYSTLVADAVKGLHEVDVRFDFTHLPAGGSISSCQGFQTELPVPTIDQTWGRLKATYR